ncbi:Glycosyltransferase [Mariniradius saccharolyticus AK6]|uniref:Glycosyltransferase n=1 Tax=Mariniradius saccharolyticus AK6 TaxID=1239962 RepID=M7XCI4_9BACT|nr:Glycosyltransferase [Mariniradius saccharolyticus AK6]
MNQSIPDFEIIVVDDGSTDKGRELVSSIYGSKVRLISQSNQGVSAARNLGIRNATFEYLAFLDADDRWHPDFLYWMKHVLDKYPGLGMVGSSYSSNGLPSKIEDPKISLIEDYFGQADYNTLFTSSSTVLHKSFFREKVGFKPDLIKGEDVDVWFRAFDWFKKACYIHAPLMFYDLNASGSLGAHPKLEQTIFADMYREEYGISDDSPSWLAFRDKYLLLNLFQYFDQAHNFLIGKKLLRQRRNSYPMAYLPYLLPLSFFKFAFHNPRLKKLIRNYLKFCFRYIYI